MAALLLLGLGPGCGEDLPTGALLDRARVLGLRVEVDGDPARAEPAAGETVTLRWLVASPEADTWTAALALCAAAPSLSGSPACSAAPFATLATPAPTLEPTSRVTIPDPAPGEILIAGALCARGVLPDCDAEGAVLERVIFQLPVDDGSEPPNHHPTLVDEVITLDGDPWGAGETPTLPRRGEEEPSTITISVSANDRESYREIVFMDTPTPVDAREEITLSHVASAGRLSRLQSVVFDDEHSEASVEWTHPAPAEVPPAGLTVRFWFVARDGRGGMDWTERTLTVTP